MSSESGSVGAGNWEFQIYFDNVLAGAGKLEVR
jgi:hypothetical protein